MADRRPPRASSCARQTRVASRSSHQSTRRDDPRRPRTLHPCPRVPAMTAPRLPRPTALATVLFLLVVAIVAFPGKIHSQVGGRVLNPNGVKPTASNVLVTLKGPNGEATRTVVAGRFTFPDVSAGTRVTLQAMAQGLTSAPVTATAPDTMVLLVLRSTSAGQAFTVAPQGAQTRARPAAQPAAPAAQPAA